MKNSYRWSPVVVSVLIGAVIVALPGGCKPKSNVICVMKNPATGKRVEMFKEIWYKVPADYDEKRHIEQWKAEQRRKGFTVEVQR